MHFILCFLLTTSLLAQQRSANCTYKRAIDCDIDILPCACSCGDNRQCWYNGCDDLSRSPSVNVVAANDSHFVLDNMALEQRRERKYYLLGNSVTRHYAFALHALVFEHSVALTDRQTEKSRCQGVLGTNSCSIGDNVKFFWKNTLSDTIASDDVLRDACAKHAHTHNCLNEIFRGASTNDVLIVGSLLSNNSYATSRGHNSWLPFHVSGPQFTDAAEHADAAVVFQMLLDTFPGRIIWHSYPFLRLELDGHKSPFLNYCFRQLNQLTACVLARFTKQHQQQAHRLHFIDLEPLQKTSIEKYVDLIHHPGELSNVIINLLLRMLN